MVKSLYDISWKCSEEEYRSDPSLSYSLLSRYYNTGFHGLSSLFDKIQTSSLLFGSAVDTLITGGKEEFDNLFYIVKEDNTSDKIKDIINSIRELFISNGDTPPERLRNVCDDEILICANNHQYQQRWKDETRVKSIRENGDTYYNICNVINNKKIISQDDYNDACYCVDALKTSSTTNHIFVDNPFEEGIERLFQLKLKFEYNGVPYRSMMDVTKVDHKNKTIQIYDLKTSSHFEDEFVQSFMKYNYWIQSVLYWHNLKENISKDDYFKDFKLLPFKFVVINRNSLMPLVWEFKACESITDLKFKNVTLKNPFKIGEELYNYLTHPQNHPSYIKEGYEESNSIDDFLNEKLI